VRWDGKAATTFVLNEPDENKAMQALLLQHPIEEAGSPFIEQHKDGYAILRGGVKKPLAGDARCGDRKGQKTRPRHFERAPREWRHVLASETRKALLVTATFAY
jgi:hypothetical protein